MSSERLTRIIPLLRAEAEAGRLPGSVLAVARRGHLVFHEAIGYLDADQSTSVPLDAIFAIASMTESIVGPAALMLLEEGRLGLADLVEHYLPQLGDRRGPTERTGGPTRRSSWLWCSWRRRRACSGGTIGRSSTPSFTKHSSTSGTAGMRTSWHRVVPSAILVVVSFATHDAVAQQRPPFPPTRDVAVTYRVENGNQPTIARLAWSVELRALRADLPAGTPASLSGVPLPPGAWVVVNLRAARAFAADDSTGLVLDLPQLAARAQAGERALAGARAFREGVDRVAGLPCTVWRLETATKRPRGRPVRVCLTADGVPLRAEEEGRKARAEATDVAYGPQDATRFQLPQGGLAGDAGGVLGRALGGMLRSGQGGAQDILRGLLGLQP